MCFLYSAVRERTISAPRSSHSRMTARDKTKGAKNNGEQERACQRGKRQDQEGRHNRELKGEPPEGWMHEAALD